MLIFQSGNKIVTPYINGGVGSYRAKTASAWLPNSRSGLVYWFKADSISASNGSAVATWFDQSGNGNDAAQTTSTQQPLFMTGIQNGLPMLLFDGSDDFFALASTSYVSSYSIFCVLKRTNTSMTLVGFSTSDGSYQPYGPYIYSNGNIYAGSQAEYASYADNPTTCNMYSNIVTAGVQAIYKDTVLQTVTHTSSSGTGSWDRIGQRGGTEYSGGYEGELFMYNTNVSSTDRGYAENYLKTKWGTP